MTEFSGSPAPGKAASLRRHERCAGSSTPEAASGGSALRADAASKGPRVAFPSRAWHPAAPWRPERASRSLRRGRAATTWQLTGGAGTGAAPAPLPGPSSRPLPPQEPRGEAEALLPGPRGERCSVSRALGQAFPACCPYRGRRTVGAGLWN